MMRKQIHYSLERLIIHSARQSRCTFGGVLIYEAARFLPSSIQLLCVQTRVGTGELVESRKGQLGVPQVHRWTWWWTVPCQRSPASERLAVNLSSGTLWTNIHSGCLSLHASPIPRSVLIIQEMFQSALLPHPINNTLRLHQDFDGGRCLMMWVTVHPAALFKW